MLMLFLPNLTFLHNFKIRVQFSDLVQKILNFDMRNVILLRKLLRKVRFTGKRRPSDEYFDRFQVIDFTKLLLHQLNVLGKPFLTVPSKVSWLGVLKGFIGDHQGGGF